MTLVFYIICSIIIALLFIFIIISLIEKKYKEDKLFFTNTNAFNPISNIDVLDDEDTDIPKIISHYTASDDMEEII